MNSKKIYYVEIDEDTGDLIEKVSFVESPAIERNFVRFSKQKALYQVVDESKHIVSGALLLANTPIYRNTPEQGEFWMVWSPEVIERYAQSYLKNGNQSNVNINHMRDVDGVFMFESYITDSSKGICPNFIQDIPDGSWCGSFKVENSEIWNKIMSGEYQGFSIEATVSGKWEQKQEDELLNYLYN